MNEAIRIGMYKKNARSDYVMYALFQPFAFNLLAYKNKKFFSKQNDSKIAGFFWNRKL